MGEWKGTEESAAPTLFSLKQHIAFLEAGGDQDVIL